MRRLMTVLFWGILSTFAFADTLRGTPMNDAALNDAAVPLLVEMVIQPAMKSQGANGFRVRQDGIYESLSDKKTSIKSDGTVKNEAIALAWRPQYTFTPSELTEVRALIRAANVAKLQPRYAPTKGKVFDAGTQTWKFWLDSKSHEIVVEGYPAVTVPALAQFYKGLQTIHKWPHTSIWRVLVKGKVVERQVNCEAQGVQALRPIVDALFPDGKEPRALTEALPTPLLEVIWKTDGKIVEETRLFQDGRRLGKVPGEANQIVTMNAGAFKRLRGLIEALDWEKLPDPLC
jgi:hypothetical protein